jgi:outer membrane lipase/esterase
MTAVPSSYELTDAVTPVCTSVDAGPGIGIGAGQVNSALCTPATTLDSVNYNNYLFADKVYPAPRAQFKFGEYATSRIQARW